jgi:hypothetical protein
MGTCTNSSLVYPLKLTTSIVRKHNELAMLVLERAAVYQEALEDASAQLPTQENLTRARLSTDYFVLRTVQVSLYIRGLLAS